MATDMNGILLEVGQTVRVHYTHEPSEDATLVEIREDDPTTNQKGCWCEIDTALGRTGMMSYILEVLK